MQVIGVFAPKRAVKRPPPTECEREVRADILSLGGAVILGICLVLSAALLLASQSASVSQLQRIILAALTMAAWLYFFDSISERLRIIDHAVEYSALLSRRRFVPLIELESMLMVYEGFNLERGIESIEFRRRGRKPDRIALGPCWQRNKLERFMRSVEEALRDPHLLEEIR